MTGCRSERHAAALSQTDDISVAVTCNNDVMTLVQVHASAEQVDCKVINTRFMLALADRTSPLVDITQAGYHHPGLLCHLNMQR